MDYPFEKRIIYLVNDAAPDHEANLDSEVIVCLLEHERTKTQERDLLNKIMASSKISKFGVIGISDDKTIRVVNHLGKQTQTILAFGLNPRQLSLNLQLNPYAPAALGPYRFLFSDSLTELSQSNVLKKQLWQALQEMFDAG